jgi:hypothetical protein
MREKGKKEKDGFKGENPRTVPKKKKKVKMNLL